MREPVGGGVVDEALAIESGEAFVGADPEEVVRVAVDLADVIVREAFGGGVGADGQQFSASGKARRSYGQREEQCDFLRKGHAAATVYYMTAAGMQAIYCCATITSFNCTFSFAFSLMDSFSPLLS